MIKVLPSSARGSFDHGWLQTRHSFSFGEYHDPARMGFRALRVINEDEVQPGRGFGRHPHRDMEILTYVTEGALRHEDSAGNSSTLRAGSFQRMSAGTGIFHSEMNASQTAPVRFLQIWIRPESKGLSPSYEEAHRSEEERRGQLRLIASRDGREDSLTIHQDVAVRSGIFGAKEAVELSLDPRRHLWVQVLGGSFAFKGRSLEAGDGLQLSKQSSLSLVSEADDSELLLFDLA